MSKESIHVREIKASLASHLNWNSLNAYEMTKLCCAEFARRGISIPSWIGLREVIGKGSANDINRGKEDYRIEHGEQMRKMEGFIDGVPEELAQHVQGFWQATVGFVRKEFESQTQEWTKQLEQAEIDVETARNNELAEKNNAETQRTELMAAKELQLILNSQIESEKKMREQSEQRLDAHLKEIQQQRDTLEATLHKNQEDMRTALQRFDAERRHSMLQIEEARTSAKRAVDEIKDRLSKELNKLELENARLTQINNTARAKTMDLENKLKPLEIQNENYKIELKKLKEVNIVSPNKPPRGTLLKQRKTVNRINKLR